MNILLNLLLIPCLGAQGAAAATLASYFLSMLLRMESAKRILPFRLHRERLAIGGLILAVQTAAMLIHTSVSAAVQVLSPIVLMIAYRQPLATAIQKILNFKKGRD